MKELIQFLKSAKICNYHRWLVLSFLCIYAIIWIAIITQRTEWITIHKALTFQAAYVWSGFILTLAAFTIIFKRATNHTITKLISLDWKYWLVLIICCYIMLEWVYATFLRRFVFFLIFGLAFTIYIPALINTYKRIAYEAKVGLVLSIILLLCLTVPGSILPPSYGGIRGWARSQPIYDFVPVSGIRIVKNNGQWQWFSPEILSPHHLWHHLKAVNRGKKGPALFNSQIVKATKPELFSYYEQLYKYHYPLLKDGIYPNEKYIGDLALVSHHPTKKFDYSNFPPNEIKYIEQVSIKYSKFGKILGQYIRFRHKVSHNE